MSRYGYFDSDFPKVTVSTTFDRKHFGELELVGAFMQYKALKKASPLFKENILNDPKGYCVKGELLNYCIIQK
ncbi:MAG: hypothetical protein NTY20_05985 [Candidatus Aenigmarchaeota archaeon]|nr:hypothetical protein [Candidatus Aenigmarchaeota archaeon]